MSTITVAIRGGFAAIASDTLTTGGIKDSASYVVNHQKILPLGESFIGITGTTTGKLMLADYFSNLKKTPVFDSPLAVFRFWTKLHKALKDDYYLRPDEDDDDSVESTRLDCLIASPYGIFGASALRTVQQFSRYYAVGSGGYFAMGAMWSAEKRRLSAEALARLGVVAACEFDEASAAPILSHSVKLIQPE
jgi:ATP-dependent protease HslVU (ClpYQ) peptidase subunit